MARLLLLARLHILYGGQTSNGRWRLSSSSVTLAYATQLTSGKHASGQSCYVPFRRHLVGNSKLTCFECGGRIGLPVESSVSEVASAAAVAPVVSSCSSSLSLSSSDDSDLGWDVSPWTSAGICVVCSCSAAAEARPTCHRKSIRLNAAVNSRRSHRNVYKPSEQIILAKSCCLAII